MFVVSKKVVPLHPKTIGLWCNGNTADSGPAFPGSSPGSPTKRNPMHASDFFVYSHKFLRLEFIEVYIIFTMNSASFHTYPISDTTVTAFSTTRHGGCGDGTYASFNCTPYTGDEPAVVRANQDQLCQWLGIPPERLVLPYQTHSSHVLTIDEAFMHLTADAKHALLQGKDALISNVRNICLCVSTADCIPILLYDRKNQAIAAIHAGWRGTVARIVEQTIDSMFQTYGTTGKDIEAIIGPGISLEAFEVGIEVYETFAQAGFHMEQISQWHADKGKHHIDLPAANRQQLLAAGIPLNQIHDSGICTYREYRNYFSARRLGIRSGRILNGIILQENL